MMGCVAPRTMPIDVLTVGKLVREWPPDREPGGIGWHRVQWAKFVEDSEATRDVARFRGVVDVLFALCVVALEDAKLDREGW
jgi:hypothetical protein